MTGDHPLRDAVLAEVHARPFAPLETPARVLHFGYSVQPGQGDAMREALAAWVAAHGAPAPAAGAKHWRVAIAGATLSVEQHSEFTTCGWAFPQGGPPFARRPDWFDALVASLPAPGSLLVAVDLHLLPDGAADPAALFDPASLSSSLVDQGVAQVASDFRLTEDGFVRMLVLDRALTPQRAGALAQRLLEIETYRTFALLGLPEAQRVGPVIGRIEAELARIGREMTGSIGLDANHRLLDRLTTLAVELEAEAAASAYRFGASRAYDEIVRQRLDVIAETAAPASSTIAAFLARRMAPAMRTCETTGQRQADLSAKLTRAADLLRTRVDVELQQQNRDLLSAMNVRAQLQLRLQQTVEGLSVAAISYYVVSLFGYLAKGLKDAGRLPVEAGVATAMSVPVAIALVWFAVRRLRRRHLGADL
jgi:uncharacterized membrane-anchored protein